MRLSYQKQTDIKEAILNDLYNPPRKKLDDKKSALVMRNHAEWVKPLMSIINQLPDNMTVMSENVRMEVPALNIEGENPSETCDKVTWSEYASTPVPIMQTGSSYYNSKEIPIPLQESLKEEVLALRLEDWNLQIEKRDMKKYLRTTLEVNNTTTKLRKAFPSTLQKYIPPEPTRAPRQAKLPINEPDAVELPGNLKLRMTENLLDN
jgi:hypothetical protein